jgi:acetylornithine deacetylase/succinyl-diaminopimelate desuccinylase-like protein
MTDAIRYLHEHQAEFLRGLAEIVAIEGVSTDGQHVQQLAEAAAWTRAAMQRAGFQQVDAYPTEGGADILVGQTLVDPALPTVLMYSHYDVQPVSPQHWTKTAPFVMVSDGEFAYGRGVQDDKGGLVAQLAALTAMQATGGRWPVNVKMLVEGLEEVGSPSLVPFIASQRELLKADVIVVTDTDNLKYGTPAITNSLRGCMSVDVVVRSARFPSHSGTTGNGLADPALALCEILARMKASTGRYEVPGLYDRVRPLSKAEQAMMRSLEADEATLRQRFGVLEGVQLAAPANEFLLRTTRWPALTIIGLEAGSIAHPSNQVVSEARAILSVRLVPDMDPDETLAQVRAFLTKDPPWGVEVDVSAHGTGVGAWMVAPDGKVFAAALRALEQGYGQPASYLGSGGTIGYVGPASELLGATPLLLGISGGNAHSHDEYLHLGDWHKLQVSLVKLLEEVGKETK